MSTSFDPSEAQKPLVKALLKNIAKNHDLLLIKNLSDFFTVFRLISLLILCKSGWDRHLDGVNSPTHLIVNLGD
jgi:hypothetical protein